MLICPSRHEPFGNVVIDGWAHKIPVVVSDTGGPGALVKNSVNGLKFKNEDFFDLIEKVKYLESKKSLVKKLIKNGYNDYESKFSEQIIINKYIKFFEKIKTMCGIAGLSLKKTNQLFSKRFSRIINYYLTQRTRFKWIL